MANRLRDLFDDSKQEIRIDITFENADKNSAFQEAVRKAIEEGESTLVDGIEAINETIIDGNSRYTIEKHQPIDKMVVSPTIMRHELSVKTDKGNRKMMLELQRVKEGFEFSNSDKIGISIHIMLDLKNKKTVMNYRFENKDEYRLSEISDYYNTVYFFLNEYFKTNEPSDGLDKLKNHLLLSMIYFERIEKISNLLGIKVLPSKIDEIVNDDLFVERVYFSLIEKKIIRTNGKVNSISGAHFENSDRIGEKPMIVTYLETVKLTILDATRTLYVVNVAFNLIIDREEENDGETKLYFRDDENNPMYISSRAFLDESDAIEEMEKCLNNKELYKEAPTLVDLIMKAHMAIENSKRNA